MDYNKKHLRIVMHYCWLRKLNGAKMGDEINELIGTNTDNERTCRRWIAKFNEGNINLDDDAKPGRPSQDIDDQIKQELILEPRSTTDEIAINLGVVKSTVWEHLQKMSLKYIL